MLSQVNLELIVEGKIGEAEKGTTVNKVNNIDTAEVLLNIKNPPLRCSCGMGQKSVIHTPVRNKENGLPIIFG